MPTVMVRLPVLLLLTLAAAGCASPPASAAPTSTETPSPSDEEVVPALTVDDPTVTVVPATNLRDGQTVEVRITGFGVGGKVYLSECSSAEVATDLGCGAELAAQTLFVTDDSRAAIGSFTVTATAEQGPFAPSQACADQCVIVATIGGGYAFVTAPISFLAPPTRVPTISPPASAATSPSSTAAGPDLTGRLTCAGYSEINVPANVLDQPPNAELGSSVQAQALRAFLTTPPQSGFPTQGWRVVSTASTRVDYLAPGRDGWSFVSVEDIENQGGWQASEYGRCDLRVVLPQGFGFASWEVDPGHPTQPDATSLTVLATERACASGKSMAGRLEAPIVLYAPDTVTIALVVRAEPGGQDCQGNSPEPVLVDLGEPLGSRSLFDGSSYPVQRRS